MEKSTNKSAAHTEYRQPGRRKTLFSFVAIAVLVVTAGILAGLIRAESQPGIPSKYARQTSFPLYFPEQIPPGLQLQKDSFSVSNDALVYSFRDTESGKSLAVTIQPRPKSLSVSEFNPTKELETRIGHAYLVEVDSRSTAAIVNNASIILINAPDGLPLDTLEQLIHSLRRVKE